jgi:hypothetical protein
MKIVFHGLHGESRRAPRDSFSIFGPGMKNGTGALPLPHDMEHFGNNWGLSRGCHHEIKTSFIDSWGIVRADAFRRVLGGV